MRKKGFYFLFYIINDAVCLYYPNFRVSVWREHHHHHLTELKHISTSSGTGKNGSYSQLISRCTFIVFIRILFAFHFQCQVLLLSFLFRFCFPSILEILWLVFRCLDYRTKLTSFCYRNPKISFPGKSAGICKCVATSQDSTTGIVEMALCLWIYTYMKKLQFRTSPTLPVDERNDVYSSIIETITRN